MALSVSHVGGNFDASGSSGTIVSDSWTSTANSDIIAVGHCFGNNATPTNGEMTDSKSNSYTLLGFLAPSGAAATIGIWHSNNTTRGASHTVTYTPAAGGTSITPNIAVCEVLGQHLTADFDTTTFNTAADTASPFSPWNVTALAAISGNQIAIYGLTQDRASGTSSFGNPSGYTPIFSQTSSSVLCSYAAYKLNETGTPTVGVTDGDTGVTSGRMLIATFKEAAGGLVKAGSGIIGP